MNTKEKLSKAIQLFNDKSYNDSIEIFKRLLSEIPDDPTFLTYFSLNHIFLSNFNMAARYLLKLIAMNKSRIENYINLGYCYQMLQDYDKAEITYIDALKIDSKNEQIFLNLGSMLRNIQKYSEAEEIYNKAISNGVTSHKIYASLSSVLLDSKKIAQAIEIAKKAIRLNDGDTVALNNIASAYIETKENEIAKVYLDKALDVDPNNSMTYLNLGVLNKNLNEETKSLEYLDKCISINPHLHDAYLFKSIIQLSNNNFMEGWNNYEYRWFKQKKRIVTSKPPWDGSDNGNKLLLWGEQGLGEQILFASILPDLKRSFNQISLVVDRKLKLIFKESFPEHNVFTNDDNWNQADFDCHLPIASLGKYFRKSIEDFSKQKAFLKSTNELSNNHKIRCGISWRSVNSVEGESKSIQLSKLKTIIQDPLLDCFSVQYTDETDEINLFNEKNNVNFQKIKNLDAFNDLHSLSKYLKSFDFLLTISNTTAHLAASLGVPTLLMLPENIGKLWYWSNEVNSQSLWYPSVKIFRQKIDNDWDSIIPDIKDYIKENFTFKKIS